MTVAGGEADYALQLSVHCDRASIPHIAMPDSVTQWLEQLGLGEYAEAFNENAVDWKTLPGLDHELLKEVGVKAVGHRVAILKAIESLNVEPETAHDAASVASPPTPAAEAERRQLTVMFCDLVGSVELGERLDVEDYRDLLARFRNAVVSAVGRYDGFVARHQGDGVLVYFGYPQAHENDAEQAVRAGLEVVRVVAELEHPFEVESKIRVGIATGPAIVGDVLSTGASDRSELAALGATPNLAARLQGEAEPNTVVISEGTQALTTGLFRLEALPARALKGISNEVTPYRVGSEVRGQSRFAARSGTRLSPFVGREEELELLTRRWSRVKEGRGQVALIIGEAGIGKSRLFERFRELVGPEPHEVIQLQCSPYHESSALYPTITAFDRALGFHEVSESTARLDSLRQHLRNMGHADEDALGLLAHMLSLPTEGRFPGIEALDPQQRRQQILWTLVNYVNQRAAMLPTLCAFEDVHWADPSTLELFGQLVESIEGARVLLIATTRPGFEAAWADMPHASVLSLSRLARDECEQLARGVATRMATLSAELVDDILSRASGNPLFIEELTRTIAQSSEGATVPATLQDSLMARLDASETGKAVAQCAAVIGRSFERGVVAGAWDGSPERLSEGLNALEQLGVLTRQGENELARYTFKHTLVRDAAYGSLLREHRASLHARVAAAIESSAPGAGETQPELLAIHYTEAGLTQQAVSCWLRAGRRAAEASADREAVTQLETGLELLTTLPDTKEKAELELQSRLQLGSVLSNTIGTAAAGTKKVYEAARKLADRVGAPEEKFAALWGLWHHYHMRGDLDEERRAADEVVKLGARLTNSGLVLQAHHVVWGVQHALGNFAVALEHADKGVSTYDLDQHRHHAFIYAGHDPGVCAGITLASVLWFLGFPDQALRRAEWALALAHSVAHPMSLAHAYWWSAIVSKFCGKHRDAIELAEAMGRYASEHALGVWITNATIVRCWAHAAGEDDVPVIDELASAVEDRRRRGMKLRVPLDLTMLAEAYAGAGRTDDAMKAIDEALEVAASTGERRWDTFALLVKAELLSQDPKRLAESESTFRVAIDVARQQGAKTGELRAATGLARLMARRENMEEARKTLAPIYDWFTEGFDTADLTEAKALLDQLS